MKEAILMILSECTTDQPAWAIAAPAKPPTKVCDELEGIPKYQVRRFQKMAAMIPARITWSVMALVSTTLAMVSAIFNSKTA